MADVKKRNVSLATMLVVFVGLVIATMFVVFAGFVFVNTRQLGVDAWLDLSGYPARSLKPKD